MFKAQRFRIGSHIEPMSPPTLTEVRRRQQAIDLLEVGLR